MEIVRCKEEDYGTLAGIWERSVMGTHDFLREEDRNAIKEALIPDYFPNVELYAVVDNGRYCGFIGLCGEMIEMLFIDDECRGRGYGSALVAFAKYRGARKVDVNEQNFAALDFYRTKGFCVTARDETDEAGMDYPILHMSL